MLEIKGKYTTAKIMIDNVEESCLKQVYAMTNHVAFTNPIIVMPDTHAGKGSVIGFTMELTDKIVPNVVGVDIGCGVLSVNIGNDISINKDNLLRIDKVIRNVIPMGTRIHDRSSVRSGYFKENFNWDETTNQARKFIMAYNKKFGTEYDYVRYDYDWFLNKCREIKMTQNAQLAIGTLGGGNHFIEIGVGNNGDLWLTVHSGSRNFGKMICDYHQRIAKDNITVKRQVDLKDRIKDIRRNYKGHEISKQIKQARKDIGIDFDFDINGMEFLEGQDAVDYFMDMIFAQKYAEFNRNRMIEVIVDAIGVKIKRTVHSIHNYINFEDFIIRKGAISSYKGELMVIPMTMADGMFICDGKSNKEWNFSAPHGAGRIMSRGNASRNIDIKDFKYKMKGIVSTSVCKSTLDESPQAYKNPKIIESAIEPTVDIVDKVTPLLNIKDKGDSMTWSERRKRIKKQKERRQQRRQKRMFY